VQAPVLGSVGGTGLGLTIAREIMQRHQGAIWVEEAEQGGASFAFALLLREHDRPVKATPPQPSPPALAADYQPTILQIDDDVDLVKVVAATLGGARHG